jgi:hypothetical protein
MKIHNPMTLSKLSFYLIIITFILFNFYCKKEEITRNDFYLSEINEPYYNILLLYNDNKLTNEIHDRRIDSEISRNVVIYLYSDSIVKINIDGGHGKTDLLLRILKYDDKKIIEIDNYISYPFVDTVYVYKQKFFYSGDLLDYSILENNTALDDSISFKYDTQGKNISEVEFFKQDSLEIKYNFIMKSTYTFDDKINPLKNSLHCFAPNFLHNSVGNYNYSYEEYFNENNITSISGGYTMISGGKTIITYKYNIHGLPKEYTIYGHDVSYKYEYR